MAIASAAAFLRAFSSSLSISASSALRVVAASCASCSKVMRWSAARRLSSSVVVFAILSSEVSALFSASNLAKRSCFSFS